MTSQKKNDPVAQFWERVDAFVAAQEMGHITTFYTNDSRRYRALSTAGAAVAKMFPGGAAAACAHARLVPATFTVDTTSPHAHQLSKPSTYILSEADRQRVVRAAEAELAK